jgi:hypothetical protein
LKAGLEFHPFENGFNTHRSCTLAAGCDQNRKLGWRKFGLAERKIREQGSEE